MADLKALIIEDDPLIAEDIAACLMRKDITVTDILYSNNGLIKSIRSMPPDIVLLDINLNGLQEGLQIAELLNHEFHLPFIYLTAYSDKHTLEQASFTEPAGYIVKPFTEAGLYATVLIAYHNHTQRNRHKFPDLMLHKINQHLNDPVSEREFNVLELLHEGLSNQQIADKLFVSPNTIKAHIKNIYFKLDTNSRSATIARLRELMLR